MSRQAFLRTQSLVDVLLGALLLGLGLSIVSGCAPGDRQPAEAPSATAVQRRALGPQVVSLLSAMQRAYTRGVLYDALALADSAARYAPDLADIPFIRGRIYTRLNRFEEARAAFEQALALDPAYPGAWYNLGHNAFLQGQYRTALAYYRNEEEMLDGTTSRERHADSGDEREGRAAVLLQIGQMYARLGRADSARQAYTQALAVDSSNAKAYGWMSDLYGKLGEPEQALAYAQRALRLEPENTEYRYGVGAYLLRTEQAAEAVAYLEAVAVQEPWHAGAHFNLGRAFMVLGRREEARRYLEKADSLQALQADVGMLQLATYQAPKDPDRWRRLAVLLQRVGRLEEAREAINTARFLSQP